MPVEIARVRAICFDVDGTLRDTDDQWVERLLGFFRPLRSWLPRSDPRAAARRAVMAIEDPGNLVLHWIDRLGLDDLAMRVARRLPAPRRLPLGRPPGMVPGVWEALTALQARYPLAVVSARGQAATLRFLDGNGLSPLFRAIATGQTTRYTKPSPEPILWAAAQLGVPPAACLMVGDTTVDMRAGRAAGCQNVGVLCGFGREAELRRAGADLILSSTADLAAYLLSV